MGREEKSDGAPSKKPPDQLYLRDLIAEAARHKLITSESKQQADLAKDARNLIHPGKATRSGSPISKATALTALTAVYRIADDLKSAAMIPP